jgi:DNA-binding MarR family transcriptional regulator
LARQSFTYRLASISEDAIGPADRMFKRRFGMHVREIRVLRLIDDQPGVTFTRLAAQTRIERTATSRIVSRLIAGGYVKRKSDERDARQRRQLLEMLDRLTEWLNTGFADALARRYPEFIPPASAAARGGKGD